MLSKAVIVIGMHRSGTSALSGELAQFGVFMGKHLFKAQAGVNDKGFWENSRLVELNEELLDHQVSSWDNPLGTLKSQSPVEEDYYKMATDLIDSEYASSKVWGMKDPRVSVLLPFWLRVLKNVNCDVNYLLMVRNPEEVAASLMKRDGFSKEKGLMLWLNYNFSAFLNTCESNRLIIDFNELLNSPESVREKISDRFHLSLESASNSSFIEKKLRKQVASNSSRKGYLEQLAQKLYVAILSDDKFSVEALECEYNEYLDKFPVVLIEHLEKVQASETHFRCLFEEAYQSISWKLSWPLRVIEKKLK
ncbi:sulfotransferase family protein [Agarivorans aestuarii]|uniref:sulfotransferase family protein n=1 Tax=Agarivorans aestuarii TaxID=1563703 RepID=UPI001C813660|nr:hypothetical protein [Agarivorans aestuarii]